MTLGAWARLAVCAVAAFLFQVALFDQVVLVNAHPDVMIVLAGAAGVVFGPARGAVIGFVAGLLADLATVMPFGLSSLTYCLVAFAVGTLPSLGTAEGRRSIDLAVVVCASAVGTLAYAALGSLTGQGGMFSPQLAGVTVVVTLSALVLGLPVLGALRWVARALAQSPGQLVPPGGSATVAQ